MGAAGSMVSGKKTKNSISESSSDSEQTTAWQRFSITAMEADLAYFEARLELIGEPDTINQKAQMETFKFLVHAMGGMLNRLKRKEPPA